jgi:hypothetical protein
MSYAEDKISIEHEGHEYSAIYIVENDVVSVIMNDRDGAHRQTSTFLDGSNAESVARLLLNELLRDMALL